MSDLANSLRQLSLGQYYDCFAEHGFEDWESLQCVTEEDFDLLGVKLGHRRILQREIAREQTLYGDHLRSSQSQSENEAWGRADSSKDYSLSSNRVKRRYRRHPKPDENAPRRPYSAYAMFSNKVREDLKDQNLSFVELARNAGERWKKLSPADKEPWISSASKAKRTYDTQLAKYRQTEEYSIYSAYLADFRSKHSKQETEDDQTSGQEPANQDRLKQDQPSQSQPSTDPAGIIPQEAENPDETDHEDEADRQESMIFNVHDLIGQESERSSFSTLEHRNFLARADFDTSQADNLRHIRVLNPFDHVTASDVRPYVDFFLDRINCVFHFFDGRELIDRFDSVFEVGRSMPNQIMSEICLVLALGVQISDGASEDKLIMWYENGRRYLDDENWRKKLWVMRLLLMISVYHVGDRQDTSHHYLGSQESLSQILEVD